MQFKAEIDGTVKKLKAANISDYNSLVKEIHRIFNIQDGDPNEELYYYSNEDKIFMENDQDYYSLLDFMKQKSIKSIKFLISVKNSSSNEPLQATVNEDESIFIVNEKGEKIENRPNSSKIQQLQNKKLTNQDIFCQQCKSQIIGSFYKCKECWDFHLCQKCFEKQAYKKKTKTKTVHNFININDELFWKKINYYPAIRKLTDQKDITKKEKDQKWISESDILNNNDNFKEQIKIQARNISKLISDNIDKWQKEYNETNVK